MKNVLLVDDDKIFNMLSTKTLERLGCVEDIHTALNGQQAIDLFNSYYQGTRALPDYILLDLNMPIMDGFGFLEAFRKLNIPHKENVKIVIVSSSNNPDDIRRARELGAVHYMSKPVSEQSLKEAFVLADRKN